MADLNTNPETSAESPAHVQRRQRLFITPDLSTTRGIEIGPLAMPLIRKSEGDIRYVDCADQATLKAKYHDDPNVDIENIVEIDGIWGEQTLAECFAGEPPFDYVVASHVIEHVPDMIGWLQEIAEVLRPGGSLYLAVPDRRFTFDYFRRTSALAEFVGAYLCRSRRPTPAQVFDQGAYWCTIDASSAWAGPLDPRDQLSLDTLRQALQTATAVARQPQYLDVHCWVFTPRSLLETLIALVDLDLLPYRCARFRETQTGELEMALVLEKVDTNDSTPTSVRQSFLDHLKRLGSSVPDHPMPSDEPTLAAYISAAHMAGDRRAWMPSSESAPALPITWTQIASAPRKVGALLRPCRLAAAKAAWTLRGRLITPFLDHRSSFVATPQPFPEKEQLGREFPEYRGIYSFDGDFIDEDHRAIAVLPTQGALLCSETPGFLRPADALTLYELAFFSNGDILEIYSGSGLATTFLCRAALNANRGMRVLSVEADPERHRATARTVHDSGLERCYRGVFGDADNVTGRLIDRGRQFGFIFVDHNPDLGAMRRQCQRLGKLLKPGGLILFHDFNDERNIKDYGDYGVYSAVEELLQGEEVTFVGMVGCCGLVRKHTYCNGAGADESVA